MNFRKLFGAAVFAIAATIGGLGAGTASAVPTPVLDYSGFATYDSATGQVTGVGTVTTAIYSISPLLIAPFNVVDPIIGKLVVLQTGAFSGYSGGSALFGDGIFNLGSGLITGNLVDIVAVPVSASELNINNVYSANLVNVAVNTGSLPTSLFMNMFDDAVAGAGNEAATRVTLTWLGNPGTFTLDPNGQDYTFNMQGKLAPVPEPGTMLLLGSGLASLAAWRRRRAGEVEGDEK